MDNRILTCVLCPNGCEINVQHEEDRILEIKGNKCPKGRQYAQQEMTDPRRTIASSVRITGSFLPLCSVRLTKPVPKKYIFPVMEEINKVELTAPVQIGKTVIRQVCGLDADVIVTKNMERS